MNVFLRFNGVTVPRAADALHAALLAGAEQRIGMAALAAPCRRLGRSF